MTITKDQIRHLGWLSRIDLSDEELERNTGHIEEIITYLDKLDSIPLSEADAVISHAGDPAHYDQLVVFGCDRWVDL